MSGYSVQCNRTIQGDQLQSLTFYLQDSSSELRTRGIWASSQGGVSVSSTLMSEEEDVASRTQLSELIPGARKLSLRPLTEMFLGKLLLPPPEKRCNFSIKVVHAE